MGPFAGRFPSQLSGPLTASPLTAVLSVCRCRTAILLQRNKSGIPKGHRRGRAAGKDGPRGVVAGHKMDWF